MHNTQFNQVTTNQQYNRGIVAPLTDSSSYVTQAYTFVDTSIDRIRRPRIGLPQVARVIIQLIGFNLEFLRPMT